MELEFDIRGYLKPYKRTTVNSQEFKEFFVGGFDKNSTRYEIFKYYEKYTRDFSEKITSNFTQLINGSFVSNKKNPNDIDLVSLVDYEIAEEKEEIIRNEFLNAKVLKNYGIDAYLLIIYPENHKRYSWTVSDLLYWEHWFSRSKMNKSKKYFPKGYVKINFSD